MDNQFLIFIYFAGAGLAAASGKFGSESRRGWSGLVGAGQGWSGPVEDIYVPYSESLGSSGKTEFLKNEYT